MEGRLLAKAQSAGNLLFYVFLLDSERRRGCCATCWEVREGINFVRSFGNGCAPIRHLLCYILHCQQRGIEWQAFDWVMPCETIPFRYTLQNMAQYMTKNNGYRLFQLQFTGAELNRPHFKQAIMSSFITFTDKLHTVAASLSSKLYHF